MKTTATKTRSRFLPYLIFSPLLLLGCGEGAEVQTLVDSSDSQAEKERGDIGSDYPENVVAVVNDHPILKEDADKRARMNVRNVGIDETDPDFQAKLRIAQRGAVEMLIESYILLRAATDTIEVTTQEVEAELLEVKKRHPNRESYEEGLRRAGFTEEQFREVIIKEIRIRKVMGDAAAKGVPTPTPEEAREFYDNTPFIFEWPYRVRYDEVVWPFMPDVSDASVEEAAREMNHLADRMQADPDLFNTVLREATSATWGPIGIRNDYMNKEGLPKDVQESLQTLNINEPSRPVRTPLGISILCIRSTRQTYDSAYREILQSIYEARVIENLEVWKLKQRDKHTIRILDLDYYEGRAGPDSESAGGARG